MQFYAILINSAGRQIGGGHATAVGKASKKSQQDLV